MPGTSSRTGSRLPHDLPGALWHRKIIFGEVMLGLGLLAVSAALGGWLYWELNRRGWKVFNEGTPADKSRSKVPASTYRR
jgi:hypothetical protein